MATKEIIFQGFTKRTHGVAIRELFDVTGIDLVVGSIAFVSESGVQQIENQLMANAKSARIFAGVRNDITSHQGLARILSTGCYLYTVDTGSRNILFHPKVFLIRGKKEARIVIGSANLTLGGLHNNIEAGALLEFDLTDKSEADLIAGVCAQFDSLPKEYPDHIRQIKKVGQLDEMLDGGLLIDEANRPPPKPSTSAKAGAKQNALPRIKLSLQPIFTAAPKKAGPPKKKTALKGSTAPATGVDYELVWESKALTRRDLTIPKAANTHATGSVNLDKGLLPQDVDHRHYFRDDVFPKLTWAKASATTEEAYAKFHLVIQGISYGEFDLRIGHTVGTTSAGYLQNNAMTRLSWGPMREYIAHAEYIGMTLSLYRDKADPTRFMLEVD